MGIPPLPNIPVTVAILTYRRQRLLGHLLEQITQQCEPLPIPIEILVVDNDPEKSAEHIVQKYVREGSARYVNEEIPGIAAARDKAIRSARNSRLLLFVDDDEIPSQEWLVRLVCHWESSGAAAVAGPVEYLLPTQVPDPWVVASGVFDRVSHPTGSRRSGASSANLLLDLDFLRTHGLGFDRNMGLRGGEDTLLTHQIVAHGGTIEWCDEAVVTETVPPDRVTRPWFRRRSFRSGASWGRSEIATSNGSRDRLKTRALIVLRSSLRIAIGGALLAGGVIGRNQARVAQQLRSIYAHAGALSAAVGAPQIEDYSRR